MDIPTLKTIRGRIHGRNIELDADPGVGDGQDVEVVIKPARPLRRAGDGILRSAGVAADVPDFDEVFAEIERERKSSAYREPSP